MGHTTPVTKRRCNSVCATQQSLSREPRPKSKRCEEKRDTGRDPESDFTNVGLGDAVVQIVPAMTSRKNVAIARQHVSTSARQHVSTSKLRGAPRNEHGRIKRGCGDGFWGCWYAAATQ